MTHKNLILLFAAGIVPLCKEVSVFRRSLLNDLAEFIKQVRIPIEKPDQFMTSLSEWDGVGHNILQMDGVRHILASIVNKRTDGPCAPDTPRWM